MALLEDSLIAHYKMNENTAGDNAELVTNGDFAAWTADNPDGWTVNGEVGADPEVSEVGTGEGHGGVGTGMCNIYTSVGSSISISQNHLFALNRKYRFSMKIDTIVAGGIYVTESHSQFDLVRYTTTGIKTFTFLGDGTTCVLTVARNTVEATDVTFDDVSFKLLAIEDSSGNDHHGVAQQDSDAISVPGKINTALEFNGTTDYIIIPDHDDFTPALTPLSISSWVNMDDATNFIIVSKGFAGTLFEWEFKLDSSNRLRLRIYDSSVPAYIGRYCSSSLVAYENQWVHFVCVYDGGILSSGIRLYLNGVRIDNTNLELGTFVSAENQTHNVWIGRYNVDYANGTIDNVKFFNKELTPLEVQLLYNGGAGVETIPIGIHLSRTGQHFSSSPMN